MAGANAARPGFGSANDPTRSIDWGSKLEDRRIDVYFAPRDAVVDGERSLGWTDYETGAALAALERIAEVADLEFRQTRVEAGAEFRLTTARIEGSDAWMNPPGEPFPGLAAIDPTEARQGNPERDGVFEPGSYGFMVLLHEFGHGVGLAHPHDFGGMSTIWQGVSAPFDDYGRALLNQGVYTLMSYNDGWPAGPTGWPDSDLYGHEASMMALDIAVLQAKYGANATHAAGDDLYRLPGENGRGATYECIWDAGGYDTIAASGPRDCVIDLRAASLLGEPGGGGWVSHAAGVQGGLTIANGVRIEAARGGSGADTLRGDAAANRLNGRAGDDRIAGRDGDDALRGGLGADGLRAGSGDDTLAGGAGGDWLRGGAGADRFHFGSGDGRDRILDFEGGTDLVRIMSGANRFADLALVERDEGAVLRFDDMRVVFENVALASFGRDDFLFD